MSKVIHTDLYSPKAKLILKQLHVYMRDKWGSSQMNRNAEYAQVEIAPNGEVTWVLNDKNYSFYRTAYANRDDNRVREWIACTMKHAIYTSIKRLGDNPNKEWKRKNTKRVIDFLSSNKENVTLAEAYCVFDKLLNRKTFAKRWSKKMIKTIVGDERDPAATELEIVRREELKKLEDKYLADKKALDTQETTEYYEYIRARDEKFSKLKAELKAKYFKDITDLNASLNFAKDLTVA